VKFVIASGMFWGKEIIWLAVQSDFRKGGGDQCICESLRGFLIALVLCCRMMPLHRLIESTKRFGNETKSQMEVIRFDAKN